MKLFASMVLMAAFAGITDRTHCPTSSTRTTKLAVMELVEAAREAMSDEPACPTVARLVARQFLAKPPRDAWGTPLIIRCPSPHGDPFDVISFGPDKKPDTGDDIVSWQL
jgi:hypothetical protein